jgi:hypothetical protein
MASRDEAGTYCVWCRKFRRRGPRGGAVGAIITELVELLVEVKHFGDDYFAKDRKRRGV